MATILLVIHLMIAVTLVATILLQRSEGGALGIGGGGGLVSNRAAGNALTRSSGILAALFFMTSIGLTLLARDDSRNQSILDAVPAAVTEPAVPAGDADATPVPAGAEESAPASDELLVPRAE